MTCRTKPLGEEGPHSYVHDLEGGSRGLSGNAYVVGELDMSHWDASGHRVPGIKRCAIPIRMPRRCEHAETVCLECAETWLHDWMLYFDRTAGGRRLRDDLGGEPVLDAMAVRRAAWKAGTAA